MASIQIIHVSDKPTTSRTIRIGKRTLSDAIRECGLKEPKCRTFAQSQADLRKMREPRKNYVWPGDKSVRTNYFYRGVTQKSIDAAYAALNAAADTVSYVKAWSLLNHLKEC